jgi:lambda repressor-like predicted transcriptional regulator
LVTPLMIKVRTVSLRQYAIAAKCGITERRFSLMVNGHLKPRPDEVRVIARVLRCSPEEIFPAAE